MMDLTIVIRPTPEILEAIRRPVRGQGGFQTLMRKLQSRLQQDALWLKPEDCVRLHKYANKGQGGFQDRFKPLTEVVNALTDICVEVHGN